ncbi:hypothetical protein [Roseovarius sp.]|uniref:hypothetical protein n=1 Tax=Roseovarius sp. TaxID=1486281 RepID=UPI003A9828B6
MPVSVAVEGAPSADQHIWVAIRNIQGVQNHCGLAYRREGDVIHLLHLAFHYDLRDEILTTPYRRVSIALDITNQLVVAGLAIAMAGAKPGIPYGFNDDGIVFDDETGQLLEAPAGRGLTCATFVTALLSHFGLELIDRESWPERETDADWRAQMIEQVEAHSGDAVHADALRSNPIAARIRPEEVAGASAVEFAEWSVAYERAHELAEKIVAELAA